MKTSPLDESEMVKHQLATRFSRQSYVLTGLHFILSTDKRKFMEICKGTTGNCILRSSGCGGENGDRRGAEEPPQTITHEIISRHACRLKRITIIAYPLYSDVNEPIVGKGGGFIP